MPPAVTADTLALPRVAAPAPAETERPVTIERVGSYWYRIPADSRRSHGHAGRTMGGYRPLK
jgi:hypothetical protein